MPLYTLDRNPSSEDGKTAGYFASAVGEAKLLFNIAAMMKPQFCVTENNCKIN